jgi:hypothetical protein
MIERKPIRVDVRVQWHANGGFTRVQFSTGHEVEIPTESIPIELRRIGSSFCLVIHPIRVEDFTNSETLQRLLAESFTIEPLIPK